MYKTNSKGFFQTSNTMPKIVNVNHSAASLTE
jgi:hypothetical protein